MAQRSLLFIAACTATRVIAQSLACNESTVLGFYSPSCDAAGNLLPPLHFQGSVEAAMNASVDYYARSPLELPLSHGFPPFVWATFISGIYIPTSFDIIAGMQDGMGLIGYIKLYERAVATGRSNASAALSAAVFLGDYLTTWCNTPPVGVWPAVTRSTGLNLDWPLIASSQGDAAFGPNCIETDRVALAGVALLRLYSVTGNGSYLNQAVHNARVLAATQSDGNATHAPWPFRVDSVNGSALNGRKNGDTVFPLRLFRSLAAPPYHMTEFNAPAARLWAWIATVQLPTARANVSTDAAMFVNFFEDRTTALDNNRNSWTALEMARYLIEQRGTDLDPDWRAHVDAIFAYALTLFGYPSGVGNVTLMGEQDDDKKGWGGANSKLGGVAAMYACAGGPAWYAGLGARNIAHHAYFTDTDGCRSAQAYMVNSAPERGGWTEDAWLDVLHNMVDALNAQEGVC